MAPAPVWLPKSSSTPWTWPKSACRCKGLNLHASNSGPRSSTLDSCPAWSEWPGRRGCGDCTKVWPPGSSRLQWWQAVISVCTNKYVTCLWHWRRVDVDWGLVCRCWASIGLCGDCHLHLTMEGVILTEWDSLHTRHCSAASPESERLFSFSFYHSNWNVASLHKGCHAFLFYSTLMLVKRLVLRWASSASKWQVWCCCSVFEQTRCALVDSEGFLRLRLFNVQELITVVQCYFSLRQSFDWPVLNLAKRCWLLERVEGLSDLPSLVGCRGCSSCNIAALCMNSLEETRLIYAYIYI